jgi:adenine deaminase
LIEGQTGLVLCVNPEVLTLCPYSAGPLSPKPLDAIVSQYEKVEGVAAGLAKLPPAPFGVLSFLGLPVIPELRLTGVGLAHVVESELLK